MLENGGGTAAWQYDAAYRLTNWQRTGSTVRNNTMTYDAAGNRLTLDAAGAVTTYTYNGANELKTSENSSGVTTYSYDGAGNQTRSEAPFNQITTNVWNDENQRVTVKWTSHADNMSIYNGDGERVENQQGKKKDRHNSSNGKDKLKGQA